MNSDMKQHHRGTSIVKVVKNCSTRSPDYFMFSRFCARNVTLILITYFTGVRLND